ncbi:MAG TPA: hypothetical protein V6D15_02335 [Oculatellaceae cyanobacterium]|jgi:hypothetical protein
MSKKTKSGVIAEVLNLKTGKLMKKRIYLEEVLPAPKPKLFSKSYRELNGKKIQIPEEDAFKPNLIALEKHYQIFLQKCGDKETP